jgi:L-asparaginase II
MIIAEVVRSGFVESVHHGSVAVLGGTSRGDVTSPIFPRSSNKPLQTVGMLRAGLVPRDESDLALISGSHYGEPFHVRRVREILDAAGLEPGALRCPAALPIAEPARNAWLRGGGEPERILMNCSGKHAGMLATCVANGWDTTTYLDPAHPLQVSIADTFAELTGEPVKTVAVDGCGAPLLSTSLVGLATAFRQLATAAEGPGRRVADAIRAHPEFASGSRRDEAALLRAVPGAIGKAGAESCYAVALADGRAVALKTDDGAARVRPVLMAAVLERLGVPDEEGVDGDAVRRTGVVELLGGGRPVGCLRPVI